MKQVDSFLNAVRRRMNRNRACRALLWAMIAGGGTLLLVACLYVFNGYGVPRYWYGIAGALTAVGGIAGALARRATVTEATEFADGFFSLRDTITSRRRFEAEQKAGGYYDLQAEATAEAISPLDPRRVPFHWPQKLGAVAAVLTVLCVATAFKATNPEIIEKQRQERITAAKMEEIKKALEEMIKELEKGAGEEEQKALNPDELRKYVAELETTKDIAEAMRQLADLERKINKAANANEQKRNEQLMKKVAEELEKEEDPQARALAKKLKLEQFKDAAKDLEKMKPDEDPDKKLSEKRKEAAKLKAAAKRMAAAARNQKSSKSKPGKDGADSEKDPNSKNQLAMKEGEQDEESLEEDLEELEMEVDEYDEALEEMEMEEGEIDPSKLAKYKMSKDKLNGRLSKLGKGLGKMGMKHDAKLKLQGLAKKAGQGQSYMQGLALMQSNGKLPGDGSIENSRDEQDDIKDNGQTTQLKGQKGQGPSVVKVEAADDGSGVSRRKGEAKERAFKMQFESFVQREDVPEDVKDGVKHYFQSLHAAEPAKATPPPADGK